MAARFPERAWLQSLKEKINTDDRYARVARNWEGDLVFVIEPDRGLKERRVMYLDLWHGRCREVDYLSEPGEREAAFTLIAPYGNFVRVLSGDWQPMQALLTRKIQVKGNMVYLMRHVPTVLEFVRCCQDITGEVLGDEA